MDGIMRDGVRLNTVNYVLHNKVDSLEPLFLPV